eukprot:Amastigsp_a2843_5.p4 type:complete len:101 gc:universal Amastigsp_a2843_5:862-560(-)
MTSKTMGQRATSDDGIDFGAGNRTMVRRLGCRPICCTPARRATTSAHAPAALMTTGALNVAPEGRVASQNCDARSYARLETSDERWTTAPRAFAPRRNAM